MLLSNDCRDGNCQKCYGDAWNEDTDELDACTHECHYRECWEAPQREIRLCRYITFPGSFHVEPEPPEYCEHEITDPDSEFCAIHETTLTDDEREAISKDLG